MAKILNFGSLNIDYVYTLDHIVQPGETESSDSIQIFAGGKGANQSVSLARAGVEVYHAGKIGSDSTWMKEKLRADGVNINFIYTSELKNGHAIIQVDRNGQNSIILHSGANHEIQPSEIDDVLSHFSEGDYLLLQNEINSVDLLIQKGHERGLKICFNPAPMQDKVLKYPLELVEIFVLNETEGAFLANKQSSEELLNDLVKKYPKAEIILTTGEKGAEYAHENERIHVDAEKIKAIDTTAAGDTFIGYFLAFKVQNKPIKECLEIATKAAGICTTKEGAQVSIPWIKDI